jgi:hypothetical protein
MYDFQVPAAGKAAQPWDIWHVSHITLLAMLDRTWLLTFLAMHAA